MFTHTTRVWHGAFSSAELDTDKLRKRERSREGGMERGREAGSVMTALLFSSR